MRGLDVLPQPESVNLPLQPVMIGGYDDEKSEKTGERRIARVVPAGFVECDDAGKAGHENDETPCGETRADVRAATDEAVDPEGNPLQLCVAR